MKKEKHFHSTKFSPEAIQQAWDKMDSYLSKEEQKKISLYLSVQMADENWNHDTEPEFFADYMKNSKHAFYQKSANYEKYQINISYDAPCSDVAITAPNRSAIEAVHQIFDNWAPKCTVPKESKPSEKEPTVFIGHGQSQQWRDLKDHLHEKHGYKIEAYEVGARAGHAIRDILEEMLSKSSFAVIVMTGEDKDDQGKIHARDNVIHELGLFQGRIGFPRAIILLEQGTEEFSNIHGIQQVRYSRNNIKETFGEVLATLKREFDRDSS